MSKTALHHLILEQSKKTPHSKALIYKEQSLDYQQLAEQILRLGQSLTTLGPIQSERIAIYLPKTIETVISFFAASAAGAIFVPINPILKATQVQYILDDCGARILFTSTHRLKTLQNSLCHNQHLDIIILTDSETENINFKLNKIRILFLTDLLNRNSAARLTTNTVTITDIAAIIYTSGSTGTPKGVVLSHQNLLCGAQSVSQYLNNTPEDNILAVLPFSFDYGFSQLTTAFYVGASVVLMDYLLPKDILSAIAKYRITGLAAVPSLWIKLAQLAWPEVCSLRYYTNSGGSLPISTLNSLRNLLPDAQPYLMYGLTEAFRSSYVPPEAIATHQDSIGIPIPNADVVVLRPDGSECADNEAGELVHRGDLVALGYWNNPKKTAQRFKAKKEVWSGDTVRRAPDGYLYFINRKDDMIKTSGYRVSPGEIEVILYQSKLIKEGIALGVEHPLLGQAIIVIFIPQDKTLQTHELKLFCKKNLPPYMQPLNYFNKEKLPHNQNGKVDRHVLANEYKTLFKGIKL